MLQINIKKKAFGNKTVLQDINLSISENGIYGVVGKNGEGKTTFFKIITSLVNYQGTISYQNSTIKHNEIAFFPTEVPIYDELTATEFSDFYKELLNLKIKNKSNLFDVAQDKLIKTFSTGMKKKAYMNAVFQKEYPIYIFDEPFNGLDLESNYLLMNYIRELSKNSIILISSHILEILYKDCNKIFLIKNTAIKEFEKEQFFKIEEELFLK
ncbi:ABC transporter ATP-binding protein [Flavobacterium sp. ALJ2]|uniref:ATP-binding cassette domain-containing protein n=1 Tax=Flavobacterium sp. ALJ2 TaxID=2786960 RepID=UPI00189F9C21|nr:ATP-binding cassette domain-containing protein [Flavobacterium sp. ALJ2]MBF7092731.1 ABC transporter ATP-binding protein [Flavobacterium sp. ALJ2]